MFNESNIKSSDGWYTVGGWHSCKVHASGSQGVAGRIQAGIKTFVTKASKSVTIGNRDSGILMNGYFQVLVSFR